MIQRIVDLFSSPARKQRKQEEAAQWAAWDIERREAGERYAATQERLKGEQPDLSLLSDDIRKKLVSLFAADNYRIALYVGGWRGINADLYFMWRSGSTQTIFQERDYGTETFIRMCKAAEAYADKLIEKRDAALRKLVDIEE